MQQWVVQQNALSQPQLEALPQRFWLKKRLTQLWNYERYEVPVSRGGHYFYLHNDGPAEPERAVRLRGSEFSAGACALDPNGAREDATVSLSQFRALRAGHDHGLRVSPTAAPTGRSGASGA